MEGVFGQNADSQNGQGMNNSDDEEEHYKESKNDEINAYVTDWRRVNRIPHGKQRFSASIKRRSTESY